MSPIAKRIVTLIKLILILNWIAILFSSDSYLITYMLVGIAGMISLVTLHDEDTIIISKSNGLELLFSVIFSILVMLANYNLTEEIAIPEIGDRLPDSFFTTIALIVVIPLMFVGGMLCAFYILKWIKRNLVDGFSLRASDTHKTKPILIFGISFCINAIVYLVIFYLAFYPGVLTADSLLSVSDSLSGVIRNGNPFFHTQIVRICINAGLQLFGNINAGVATFIVFQILFVSACFAYMTVTLYQMGLDNRIIALISLIQLALPYNIANSVALWKEAMFGGSILLFVTAMFRYMENVGQSRTANAVVLITGALGMCLFRHNGFYSFIICIVLYAFLFRRKNLKILIMLVSVIISAYILTRPVMTTISRHEVAKSSSNTESSIPDVAESTASSAPAAKTPGILTALSVPSQQMARVVYECEDLTEEQLKLLSKIMDVNLVPNAYNPYIFDSTASLIYSVDGNAYFNAHRMEVLKLYLELGLTHPKAYIKAWVDQTYGYWNGGNWYWFWGTGVRGNDFGIEKKAGSELAEALVEAYLWCFTNLEILLPIVSIGLYTWLTATVTYIGIKKRNKNLIFLTIIPLSVIIILCLCAPVFSEDRYAYPVMECLPFIITAGLWMAPDKNL